MRLASRWFGLALLAVRLASRWVGLALLVAGLAPTARPAHAQAPDTTLGDFFRGLADSTDRYFGSSAAPLDTVGLDSTLAYRITQSDPRRGERPRSRFELSPSPWLGFNRVDGALWGGGLGIGRAEALGILSGRLGYAAGPNDWLGGAEYRRRLGLRRAGGGWSLRAFAGRLTAIMDPERHSRWLATARALVSGGDRSHYLRRDGVRATLERETATWRLGVGYRDELETPLATTTTWNLRDAVPALVGNLAAVGGRVREAHLLATARVPGLPLQAELGYRTSLEALGSAFDYRRLRVAVGGDVPVGRFVSLVPQAVYGRLDGDAVPQASFFIGGSHSLRSLPSGLAGGTSTAYAHADLIGAADLARPFRISHLPAVPVQAGLFVATGAVWGRDPYGGPGAPGGDWPGPEAWLSEVGASLLCRPGLPEPEGFVRLDVAWPLGRGERDRRFAISYTRALDVLNPLD